MALDLGTLGVRVQATTGDTVSRLDEVRSSLENIEESAKTSSNSINGMSKVDMSGLTSTLKDVKGSLNDLSGKTVDLDFIDNISGGITAAQNAINNFSADGILKQLGAISVGATSSIGSIIAFGASLVNPITAATAVVAATYKAASEWVSKVDEDTQKMIENCKKVSDTADAAITDATKTGLTVEQVQVYQALAGITDTSWEAISSGISKIGTALEDTKSESYKDLAAACKELHVALVDESGNPRLKADIFNDLTTAFQNFDGSDAAKDALAIKIFGRNYQELVPLLNMDTSAFADSVKRLEDMKVILNGIELEKMGALNDALEWLKLSEQGLANAEAIKIAVDTTKLTEAETMFNQLKIQAISDGVIYKDMFDEAAKAYGSAYANISLTSKTISDTEKYLDSMWKQETSYSKSEAYFNNFDANGDFYSLIAGGIYWMQGFGAELETFFYDVLDWMGIMDVDFKDAAEITAEEDGKVAYMDVGAGRNLASADGSGDAWDTIYAFTDKIKEETLAALGVSFEELPPSVQKMVDQQFTNLEDVSYEDEVIMQDALSKVITNLLKNVDVSNQIMDNDEGWYWDEENRGYGVYGQADNFRAEDIAATVIDSGLIERAVAAAQAVVIPPDIQGDVINGGTKNVGDGAGANTYIANQNNTYVTNASFDDIAG